MCVHSHQRPRTVEAHVLSVKQVGLAGGCGNFAEGCGVVCLVAVFLVPVGGDVVLTASVVLRAKGLP